MARTPIHQTLGSLLALALVSSNLLLLSPARAEVPLRQAVIQSLRNSVRLLLQNQSPRPAQVKDSLVPGDGVATARRSRAELRFNDGSLARVGEQALFRFLPHTRTFQLTNGTVLLLIPRGRGQTQLRTPNAVTGIRGSALFVRYLPESDTTIVGALTTSGIEVVTGDRTQSQPLEAGQMAVVVKDRIERILNFDLRTFYETSSLVSGLNLTGKEPSTQIDADLATVQEETSAAVSAQVPIAAGATSNPDFLTSIAPSQSDDRGSATAFPGRAIDFTLTNPSVNNQPLVFPPTDIIAQPPGLDRNNQGRRNDIPPGLAGTTPGLAGRNPGRGVSGPPGLPGTAPGLTGNTPGRGGSGPPGLTGTAPGLAGNTPGQGGSGPPGLTGTAPGLAGNTPGRSGR